MEAPNPFYWKGVHHGYLGIAFMLFGGIFLWLNEGNNLDFLNPIFNFFLVSGGYLIIDDAIEHTITKNTPLRIIWERLLRRQ